ncbi:Multidrug and toxin extrusion protein 1-like [Oopsacas minuta]|uniref:Multidrug and toxin extrusion protein n=1 Tax=Oopsacas minuta TaxID=111878 RepID=A0AAV7JNU7_9METZ|nr:Multidrug and toxin extrusion protein 1-like [Oopsacas minuta]
MQEYEQVQPKKWYKKLLSFWLVTEFLTINKLAWPCAITAFGSQMLPVISLFFTGHIGEGGVYLDGAALALSFANISCKSIMIGLSSGMDTLCSQAYGAKNYPLVGLYFQRALLIGLVSCLPIIAVCLNAEPILIMIHQDPQVAAIAGKYLKILCISNPAVAIYFMARKYVQSQRVVYPCIILNVIGNLINVTSHYILIIQLKLGVEGAAISLVISYWSLAIIYMGYIRCSSLYKSSWQGLRMDALKGWLHYCKFGVPGLIMLCLDWWTFEIGFLIVGATSVDPKIQVGIFSVMLNVSGQLFTIPVGFGIAATVRVGNLLGANNPSLARKTSYLCLSIIFLIGMHFSVAVFLLRSNLAQLFTKDECIIAGASSGLYITAIYLNFDGLKLIGGAIIKGCGRQKIGSITNLIVYQLFAVPLSICLCVVAKMEAKGYWIGMASAIILQSLIFLLIVICTNWRKVADEAQENAGIKSIYREQHANHEYESLNLLTSRYKVDKRAKERKFSGSICKIIMIGLFVALFALGFGFSFKQYDNKAPARNVLIDHFNSSLNISRIVCQY